MAFNEPNLERVIEKMLAKPYHGRVLFTHLSKMSPEDFSEDRSAAEIKLWFSEHSKYFAKFFDDKQTSRIVMFSIRFSQAKLCWRYQLKNKKLVTQLNSQILGSNNIENNNDNKGCNGENCKLFHLCKGYVDESCIGCGLNHSLCDDEHNMNIVKEINLKDNSDESLLKVIKLSQPQICHSYNRLGSCNYETSCTRLHLCLNYALGNCNKEQASSECKLSHSLTTTHTLRLLNEYDIWYNPHNVLSVLLQISTETVRNQQDDRNRPKKVAGEVLEDLIYFRSIFSPLEEETSNSPSLSSTKTTLPSSSTTSSASAVAIPVRWQVDFLDEWFDFNEEVIRDIEVAYADPNNNVVTVDMPSEITSFVGTKITISFDKMEGLLDDGQQKLKVQRLETSPELVIYLWYYKNKENIWDILPEYDKMESALKNSQKRYKLMIGDSEHRIKFEDMTLKDLRKGDCFEIRRRPVW